MTTLQVADTGNGALPDPKPISLPEADPREGRARPQPKRFLFLMAELAVLLLVFKAYRIEDSTFLRLAYLVFGGFAIHYWLAFRFKEPFWILLSLAGAYLLLDPLTATLLISVGLALFAILASPLKYSQRVAIIAAIAVLLMYGRVTGFLGFPSQFWPVFGAIFMFRMMIYLYDLRHLRERPSIIDYLRYFFLLPNYYFLLFPVIDFQTLRRTYLQRDIHDVAQQGIAWIVRGTIQLLLYRVIYFLKGPSSPATITTFGKLLTSMVLTYLLYLRVSGQFHVIVGMLHLFGYDLPETHRRYLLARSLTDFWRRINIYWKDFMVKLIYFPVYFKLRRRGELKAQVVGTLMVFITTWLFHSYQWFWLKGEVLLSWPDTLFWAVLGVLVTINILWEAQHKGRKPTTGWWRVRDAVQVAATFCLIVTLWSMWNAPSLEEWVDVLTWWRVG